MTITAVGAAGGNGLSGFGNGNPGGVGGLGAKVVARQVPVVPGETLWYGANSDVLAGGLGGRTYANVVGGHGGNGSFVATAQPTLTDEGASCALPAGALLVVAAGGGGGGGGDTGGPGGAGGGADGGLGRPGGNNGVTAGAGGGPGTDSVGGAAGAAGYVYDLSCFCRYQSGPANIGGQSAGGSGGSGYSGASVGAGGGGGGGGWQGGGGGGGDGKDLSAGGLFTGGGGGSGGGGGGGGSSMGGDITVTTDPPRVSIEPLFDTTTTLRSSANPALPGTAVSVIAQVDAAGGTVTFYDRGPDGQAPGVNLGVVNVHSGSAILALSGLSTGTHQIVGFFSGWVSSDGRVLRSSRGVLTQSVKASQTITFTSARDNPYAGGPDYAVSAVSSAGLPVLFRVSPPAVCTVSGTTVSFLQQGTCTVEADQAGSDTVAAAMAQQVLSVGSGLPPLSQEITFTSPPTTPPNRLVMNPTGPTFYSVTAVGGASGNPIVFSIDAISTSGACSVSGATGPASASVQILHGGICMIDADQAGTTASDGSAAYLRASQRQLPLTIAGTQQEIIVGSSPPTNMYISGTASIQAVRASSDLPVSASLDPMSVGCHLDWTSTSSIGGVDYTDVQISGTSRGTCLIDLDQPGDVATYAPASLVQESVSVTGVPQHTPTFDSYPGDASIGATYTPIVSPPLSSTATVIGTSTPDICIAADNGTVTFQAVGTCTVTADAAGDATYDPAPQATQDIPVVLRAQSIGFTAPLPDNPVAGQLYRPATFGGGSGQPVVVGTATPLTCTSDGATLSLIAVGTCTITLDQAGDARYAAAPHYGIDMSIGRGTQTIGFTSVAPSLGVVSGTYEASVNDGGSSQPTMFGTTTPGTCTVDSAGVVTFLAVGTCTITADQAGDTNYTAAAQVSQDVTVASNVQTINFTAPATATYGDTATLSASGGGSGNPVTFTVDLSSDPGACAVDGVNGDTVTFTGVGNCVLDADQAASDSYSAASEVRQTITVNRAPLTITASDVTTTYGDAAPAVTPIYSGFAGTDDASVLTYAPACSANTTSSTPSGSYLAATCSGASANNYTISYAAGTVRITKAVLTVHATSTSRVYGATNPGLTYTITGYVNNENLSSVVGAPALTTTATATSHPGDYPITVGTGTLTAANYSFAVAGATLTITRAGATINAAPISVNASIKAMAATFSAAVTNATTHAPVTGITVTFAASTAKGPITCTAVTGSNGVATCTVASKNVSQLKRGTTYSAQSAATLDYYASTAIGLIGP